MRKAFIFPLALAGSCFPLLTGYSTRTNNLEKMKHIEDNLTLTKTFIWGNGVYQPRPDASGKFRNFEPKLIKTFLGANSINLRDISFGIYHESGIDVNGNLYIWKDHKLDSFSSIGDDERQKIIDLDSGKNNKQATFSKEFLWVLKENGDIYQYDIFTTGEKRLRNFEVHVNRSARKVQELKDIVQISSGEDHFAALDKNGNVWMVGDDTLGQCGQGAKGRNSAPPFFPTEMKKPYKIPSLSYITKIACGANHTLALNRDGVIFGWGSNSNLQLSHFSEFCSPKNPLLAIYAPVRIEKNIGSLIVSDIAAGDEFSMFVGRNRYNQETEVFGCGINLQGEIGIGNFSHIQEVTKLKSLSNYKVQAGNEEEEENIGVTQISCGKNHCLALLNIGAVLVWGANEFGQLGNRKRISSENPVVIKDLTNENVLKISCGQNSSAVICDASEEANNH